METNSKVVKVAGIIGVCSNTMSFDELNANSTGRLFSIADRTAANLRICQLVGLFISLLRRAKVVFFAGSENPSIFERQAFGNIHRKRLGYTCKLAHISIAAARL